INFCCIEEFYFTHLILIPDEALPLILSKKAVYDLQNTFLLYHYSIPGYIYLFIVSFIFINIVEYYMYSFIKKY
ncbi:MAG: hypothetical protein MUO60_07565, partial [Clostridiaceae bacterium]|nr:hypothetical protein [Clostridiaceae bacterium]